MRSSWNMWEPTWVSRSRCWLLTGERLGHVCMVPEPVGSTHLRFVDARVIKEVLYVVTECCLESRMRFRTSRGVPEWSGGKDLYIGSMVLATGSVLGITGSVPGPPEVSGGPPSGATGPGGLHGLSVGGDQPQVCWCAPHKGPRRLGFGDGAPHLAWGASFPSPPLAATLDGFGAAAPLGVETLKGAHPLPLP